MTIDNITRSTQFKDIVNPSARQCFPFLIRFLLNKSIYNEFLIKTLNYRYVHNDRHIINSEVNMFSAAFLWEDDKWLFISTNWQKFLSRRHKRPNKALL